LPSLLALRHVAFEDLGSLEPLLRNADFSIEYLDVPAALLDDESLIGPDLLVVLGGPIGVYEEERYPFLRDELAAIRGRLSRDRPTLGICLGAQLIASALGARVYAGGTKEIGWAPIALSAAGRDSSLAHLDGAELLHWHGDTFELPKGAELLASTERYEHQAFRWGDTLALQFHPEVTAQMLERWYVGHAVELAGAEVDVPQLRAQSRQYAPLLEAHAELFLHGWLREAGLA